MKVVRHPTFQLEWQKRPPFIVVVKPLMPLARTLMLRNVGEEHAYTIWYHTDTYDDAFGHGTVKSNCLTIKSLFEMPRETTA